MVKINDHLIGTGDSDHLIVLDVRKGERFLVGKCHSK